MRGTTSSTTGSTQQTGNTRQSQTGNNNSQVQTGNPNTGGSTTSSSGAATSAGPTYMPTVPGTACHTVSPSTSPVTSAGQSQTETSTTEAYQLLDMIIEEGSGNNSSSSSSHSGHGHQGNENLPPGMRFNQFRNEGTPNPVIFQSNVPNSGPGFDNQQLFTDLGSLAITERILKDQNEVQQRMNEVQERLRQGLITQEQARILDSQLEKQLLEIQKRKELMQKAAQEYLLAGMPKGAMLEARRIAMQNGRFISVRPTGVAAHMGIESGTPTKPQEIKNKTSKPMDTVLNPDIKFEDVGAVVHYDPRVGWTPGAQNWEYFPAKPQKPKDNATQEEKAKYQQWLNQFNAAWAAKRQEIEARMQQIRQTEGQAALDKLGYPKNEDDWKKLEEWFESRLLEFSEEDPQYTRPDGHYYDTVTLDGPFIRLRQRDNENIYGDHDLFGFGQVNGDTFQFIHDSDSTGMAMQRDLQFANVFQAQHGGIWNWRPDTAFNQNIKNKIMGAHSPPDGEPLLVFAPDGSIQPMFYMAPDQLKSAWDFPEATKWLTTTPSGRKLVKLL